MGTTKRKKTPKKTPKSNGKAVPAATSHLDLSRRLESDVAALTELAQQIEARTAELTERLATCAPDTDWFPQNAMRAALVLERIAVLCASAAGRIQSTAVTHQDQKGVFEHGAIAVATKTTGGQKRPAWRNIAVEKASECASLRHGMQVVLKAEQHAQVLQAATQFHFDAKVWEAEIKANTTPGASHTSVVFTETQ